MALTKNLHIRNKYPFKIFPQSLTFRKGVKVKNLPSLSELEKAGRKVIMFGGKGGVGKTTCAAVTAVHFARKGKKTLIISTDAMPSLSDIFETNIGPKQTKIKELNNLYGVEIGADEVIKRWKKKFGPEVYEALSTVLPVEYNIIDYIAGAPGIDQEFMLDYILELIENKEFEVIIWDTAPSGHTMRLLSLPYVFLNHLEAAAKVYVSLQGYVEKLRSTIGLRKAKRSPLEIIRGWRLLAEKVIDFLKSPEKTEFIVVTLPEALGVYQTERIIQEFTSYGVNIERIIINYVIPETGCDFLDKRKKMQNRYIEMLRKDFGREKEIIEIPLFPYEVKGMQRLLEVEGILFKEKNGK